MSYYFNELLLMNSVEVAMIDDSVEVSDNLLWQANAGPCRYT